MHSCDDPTGGGGEHDGQAIRGLHGECRSVLPVAGVDDDAVGVDGSPLPRRRLTERLSRSRQSGRALASNDEFHPGRMSLIHPDDIASEHDRQGTPAIAHERLLVAHVEANIAA